MQFTQFHKIAKALADPRRFEVFEKIAQAGDEMCCGSISECFPVSQATISHHLKELTDAGLIEPRVPPVSSSCSARAQTYSPPISRSCRDALT